jgi:chromosome segregation ATPase
MNLAPSFLKRKEPQMEGNQLVSPQTAKILDDIARTAQRASELEAECEKLKALNSELARERDFYRREFEGAERRRDMYQRHSVALFTRLTDEVDALEDHRNRLIKALSEARLEATSGGAVEQPIPPEGEERLRDLTSRLAAVRPEGEDKL